MARNQLFTEARPNVTRIAILVTDGKANREPDATQLEANLTKAEKVEVFSVGITSDVCIDTFTALRLYTGWAKKTGPFLKVYNFFI